MFISCLHSQSERSCLLAGDKPNVISLLPSLSKPCIYMLFLKSWVSSLARCSRLHISRSLLKRSWWMQLACALSWNAKTGLSWLSFPAKLAFGLHMALGPTRAVRRSVGLSEVLGMPGVCTPLGKHCYCFIQLAVTARGLPADATPWNLRKCLHG